MTTQPLTATPGTGDAVAVGLEEALRHRFYEAMWNENIRLKKRVADLESRVASQQRWNEACLRDLERLKKLVSRDRVRMPKLASDRLSATVGAPSLRATPNRVAVIKRDGNFCRYCGRKVTKNTRHIDHVLPVALGGKTELDNLVVACRGCNYRKGTKTLEEAGMVLRASRGDAE